MAAHLERERRFLLLDFDRSALETPFLDIRQGYFDTPPELDFRVRITDGAKAVLTAKVGTGMDREEEDMKTSVKAAEFTLRHMPYRIHKHRHLLDSFEVDEFQAALAGLVLAEREAEDADVNLVKPAWITEWIEITDSISNKHLARLAFDLEHAEGPVADITQMLLRPKIRKAVITGAPCSGKSTILEYLRGQIGGRVHCVPEVATIVISQVGAKPPVGDTHETIKYQRLLSTVQKSFESLSAIQAFQEGKSVLVMDRGVVDNAAYLERGLEDLRRMLKTTIGHEYAQYDLVIHLGLPPEEIYEQHRLNNPARRETYAQAKELDRRIHEVWSDHSHYVHIDGADWSMKHHMPVALIDKLPHDAR